MTTHTTETWTCHICGETTTMRMLIKRRKGNWVCRSVIHCYRNKSLEERRAAAGDTAAAAAKADAKAAAAIKGADYDSILAGDG